MLFLYKLEIALEQQNIHLIVVAESDEQAFDTVESQLARHFIKSPVVKEVALIERKKISPGTGYLMEG